MKFAWWVVVIALLLSARAYCTDAIVALTAQQTTTLNGALSGASSYVAPASSGPVSVPIELPDALQNDAKHPTGMAYAFKVEGEDIEPAQGR